MQDLLLQSARALRDFLGATLPKLASGWWEECVYSKLSFQQQRIARERNAKTLDDLDLAALLRVVDQNWHELAHACGFPGEMRNWLKELQSGRNRWAHAGGSAFSDEDVFRDLDTLHRFLRGIGAKNGLLETVSAEKNRLSKVPEKSEPPPPPPSPATIFVPGDLVALRSNPSITGAVLQAIPGSPQNRYLVFSGGQSSSYYESQLVPLSQTVPAPSVVDLDEFHCALSALQLREPGLAHLYSLHAARISFVPYQFRPVLRFIRADHGLQRLAGSWLSDFSRQCRKPDFALSEYIANRHTTPLLSNHSFGLTPAAPESEP